MLITGVARIASASAVPKKDVNLFVDFIFKIPFTFPNFVFSLFAELLLC